MLGLTGFLGLTQIPQIPRYCFVGGKSHRCFCVWAPGGCTGLALTDLFFGPFRPFSNRTNQTYRTYRTNWTFLKIIREICGICVRPRWPPWGREWGQNYKKLCYLRGVLKILKKRVEKVATLRNFCNLCVLIIKKCVGRGTLLPAA